MDYSVVHTADPQMKQILNLADSVSASRAAVLITGESGTGKELLARFIHAKSHRSSNRFVALNCAAIPENLLESELFGFEKGAFTGATGQKMGKFQLAHGSSLLLDEIGEMPLLLQAKLLRVIQEGEFERLGGTDTVKVNVRIIATTNRDLKEMVEEKKFREDLYYRLNVIPIHIPPLRARPRDIEILSQMFIEISRVENKLGIKSLSQGAKEKIMSWGWPGNIRELRNVIERAVLVSPEEVINPENIILDTQRPISPVRTLSPGMTVSEMEKELILETLKHTNQNRTRAAELLGISIRTLRNKINQYQEAQSL